MKRITILVVLFISLVSCSNDNDQKDTTNYLGKWKLTSMSRNKNPFANSIDVMEWQESYVFSSNGKFSKTRIKDNKTTTQIGTYLITETSDQTQLKLTYTAQSDIIGTCTGNLIENLYVLKSTKQLYSTWGTCDGPLLVYDRL
ncbi:hypothetical protein [Flavobacterium panacagri]|uniref:hypothetical protein n=1 Tax=Flavobacterium panacagri TaxID=3034146 RepID=UPI0025A54030|nr:hypothetical protein [Flavobacterium panacagri]